MQILHLAYMRSMGILLLFTFLVLCEQEVSSQSWFSNAKHFTAKDGFPGSTVQDIAQDSHGFMWFATNKGLVRFDGTDYAVFLNNSTDSNSLANNYVRKIKVDTNLNGLWIGTKDGLDFKPIGSSGFQHFINPGGNKPNTVYDILQHQSGTYIALGKNGLVKLDTESPGNYEPVSMNTDDPNTNVTLCLAADHLNPDVIWVGTNNGLVKYNTQTGKSWIYHAYIESETSNRIANSYRKIFVNAKGRVFLGTLGEGLFIINPGDTATQQIISNPMTITHRVGDVIFDIDLAEENKLWISSYVGLVLFNMDSLSIEKYFQNDPENEQVYGHSLTDRDGRIWYGSMLGLYLYDELRNRFVNYQKDEEAHILVFERTLFLNGKFYLAIREANGIQTFDEKSRKWEELPIDRPGEIKINYTSTSDIVITDDSILYYIDGDGSAYVLDQNKTLVPTELLPSQLNVKFRYFLKDHLGFIWVSTYTQGVFRLDMKTGEYRHFPYGDDYGMLSQKLGKMFQDSKKNIWFSSISGLSKYDYVKDEMQHFPLEFAKTGGYVTVHDLSEDANGNIWLAGGDLGLCLLKSDSMDGNVSYFIEQLDDLQSQNVFDLHCDKIGSVWFIGNTGLEKYSINEGTSRIFSTESGVMVHDIRYDHSNIKPIDPIDNNRFIMGFNEGLLVVSPDRMPVNMENPMPYLTSFSIFNREQWNTDTLLGIDNIRLIHNQNYISFGFSSICYTSPELAKYEYMLEGINDDWIPANKGNNVSYSNLFPGDYVFRVKTSNSDGTWSSNELALSIYIVTPWWSTWWFRTLIFLVIVSIIVFLYQVQLQQAKKKNKLKANIKARILRADMQALRSQMNPHFVYNCLNSIDYYILDNDAEKASEYLNKFSRLIRLILQNSTSEYVNFKDESEAIRLYVQMEHLRFDGKFDAEFEIDESVDIENIEVPPMLIQPYIENAIWHGLMHKDSKGKLKISFRQNHSMLLCTVEDNGVGRDGSEKIKSKSSMKKRSMGMRITKDRMSILNLVNNVNANIEIVDLFHENGEAAGTKINIEIPFK